MFFWSKYMVKLHQSSRFTETVGFTVGNAEQNQGFRWTFAEKGTAGLPGASVTPLLVKIDSEP